MNIDPKALDRALRNRKAELLQLIEQMKSDSLHKSTVLKNLEQELSTIDSKLNSQTPPFKQ